MPKFKN